MLSHRPDPSDRAGVAEFVRQRGRAVVATVTEHGMPEATLVGVAALDDGTLIFNTERTARKVTNLRRRPHVAVVIGTEGDITVQLEGPATIAEGNDVTRFGGHYDAQFPGSRALDPDFAVVVVRPEWIRVYDASTHPPHVAEA